MIFAILGVIILIVSFAFALISLVKEQNRQLPQVPDLDKVEKPDTEVLEQNEPVLNQPALPKTIVHKTINAQIQDLAKDENSWARFPWDQNFQPQNQPKSVSDEQKKIEEIEAKLAQIKSKSAKNPEADTRTETQPDSQTNQKDKLHGEFKISEISEKAA